MNKQLFAQTAPPPLRGRRTGWGQIRRGYLWSASVRSTKLFFPIIEGKTIFVSSTAKRQRGLQRGKPGSPLPCFASFCRSKRKAPAASGVNYAFAKGSTPPTGEMRICPGKRIEKSSCHSGTGALFAGVNGEHQTALSTLPERKQRVQA